MSDAERVKELERQIVAIKLRYADVSLMNLQYQEALNAANKSIENLKAELDAATTENHQP